MTSQQKPIIDSNSVNRDIYRIYTTKRNVAIVAIPRAEVPLIENTLRKYKGKPIPDEEIVHGIELKVRSGKYYIANQVTQDFKINELSFADEIWE